MDLSAPLSGIDFIPAQRVRQLARLGIVTVEDLLTHFPWRYEDRRHFDSFPQQEGDRPVLLCGMVAKAALKRFQGWRKMFELVLEEEGALGNTIACRWFNMPYMEKAIASGHRLVVFGRPKLRGKKVVLDHPEYEVVEEEDDVMVHMKRITPVYRATEGLKPKAIRSTIFQVLAQLDPASVERRLPPGLDDLSTADALRQIHFPEDAPALATARRHLVLAEFFAMQMFVAARRAETVSRPGESHCGSGALLERFRAALPFPLTAAQCRTIEEIRGDLAATRPMNRLLHGDVGSGKTLVALSAMLLAVEAGHQAALMAPTQILAEQHYLNFKRWLEPLGLRIALRTGARKEDHGPLPLFAGPAADFSGAGSAAGVEWNAAPPEKRLPEDAPQIILGTHALLYEEGAWPALGLVVIDEQHKFGVMQRARLINQGRAPDVLVMTATPIPRTLTMTLYGDLDVSTLDELPANRGVIKTRRRGPDALPRIVAFMKDQLDGGRQAYIVYPLIEESTKGEVKAAVQEFERWRELLAPASCELLHGRVEAAEKDAVMERFRTGVTSVLIATSVIEVGIDVPNANLMLIENAERFGLAQLHQLRGRIGRGPHESYCILLSAGVTAEAEEKLATLEATSDGFEIAEADLKLRGPGDLLGTAQSGLPPLKLGDLRTDAALMQLARRAAIEIFARDPKLNAPEHACFRRMISETKKLLLSQVS
jgi:ATP-dependent DNA helicase RecG